MDDAPILIQTAAEELESAQRSPLTRACSGVSTAGRCELVSEKPRAIAVVTWEAGHVRARIEVRARGPGQRTLTAESVLSFSPEDALDERWRTIGLSIGSTLNLLLPPAPTPPPEPAPPPRVPLTSSPPHVTVSLRGRATPEPSAQHGNVSLGVSGAFDPELAGPRFGASLGVTWTGALPPLRLFALARYQGTPPLFGLRYDWVSAELGLGVTIVARPAWEMSLGFSLGPEWLRVSSDRADGSRALGVSHLELETGFFLAPFRLGVRAAIGREWGRTTVAIDDAAVLRSGPYSGELAGLLGVPF